MKTANSFRYTRTNHGFDAEQFKPMCNSTRHCNGVKPSGGLWLSINEGWEHFMRGDMLPGTVRFGFDLKPDARVLCIDSMEVLESLPTLEIDYDHYSWCGVPEYHLDFEKLAESYDVVEVMIQSSEGCDLYYALYGWDCDSAVVFHPECIAHWEEIEPYDNRKEWEEMQEMNRVHPGEGLLTLHNHEVVWGLSPKNRRFIRRRKYGWFRLHLCAGV